MILGVYSVGCNRGPIRHRNVPDGPVFYLVKRGKGFLSSYWQVFSDIYRIIKICIAIYLYGELGSVRILGSIGILWFFDKKQGEAGMEYVL